MMSARHIQKRGEILLRRCSENCTDYCKALSGKDLKRVKKGRMEDLSEFLAQSLLYALTRTLNNAIRKALNSPGLKDLTMNLAAALMHDEAGFVVSAELVLVSTIVVIGMIVGLSEVANGINQELEDVGAAFGSINQSYCFSGFTGHKGHFKGSDFKDHEDYCDSQFDIKCDGGSAPEASKGYHN